MVTVGVSGAGSLDELPEMLLELRNRSVPVADVAVRQPTLDDVFLRLTGEPATRSEDGSNGNGGSPNGHGSNKGQERGSSKGSKTRRRGDAKVGAGQGSKER